ncbi:MAG: TFIIB-type zinc ribbon-containing protein [Thermomicrobiales bacterium]
MASEQIQQSQQRTCPECGSDDTLFVQRGFAGTTDEHNQYFTCKSCGRVTFEILSRTPREVRVGRLDPGRQLRHEGGEYTISRVLKVGLNESLIYLKPADEAAPSAPRGSSTRLPPRRR